MPLVLLGILIELWLWGIMITVAYGAVSPTNFRQMVKEKFDSDNHFAAVLAWPLLVFAKRKAANVVKGNGEVQ